MKHSLGQDSSSVNACDRLHRQSGNEAGLETKVKRNWFDAMGVEMAKKLKPLANQSRGDFAGKRVGLWPGRSSTRYCRCDGGDWGTRTGEETSRLTPSLMCRRQTHRHAHAAAY